MFGWLNFSSSSLAFPRQEHHNPSEKDGWKLASELAFHIEGRLFFVLLACETVGHTRHLSTNP